MLDVFNIPTQQENIKIFYSQGNTAWQTWAKPRNCNFVWMMCIGGGSGGAGGVSGSINSSISANGGGSGAITRALFPSSVLPDTLFVQPGPGGAGGIGTTSTGALPAGEAGNRSFVSIAANNSSMNLVCASGAVAATAAGGAEQVISTTTTAGLLSLGMWSSTGGVAHSTSNITPYSSTLLTGGGGHGGSGTQTLGASILSANFQVFSTPQISAGAVNSGAAGANGIWSWKPMYGTGGACGGTNNAGVGGNGGNGAYGCGGGAGGVGTNAAGGNGGKGGDGLVIIVSF